VYDARSPDGHKVLPLSQLLSLTADAVAGVQAGRSLSDLLPSLPPGARPGVQALTFHVLRWWGSAQTVRRALAPKTPPPNVDALLSTALALMWPPALASGSGPLYADHTLVDQAVQAARRRTPQAASFINAVLRRFLRERDAVVAAALQQPLAAWNHPAWWVKAIEQDWPSSWTQVLHAANQRPPMTLRVNVQRVSPMEYLQRLADAGLNGRVWPDPSSGPACIVLETPCPVSRLPGFDQGDVSVQDAAAQRAALLLCDPSASAGALPASARVLDACAAPGGKTAHLLEHRPDLEVVALDADATRLERVKETLERLHLVQRPEGPPPQLQAADARDPAAWWDGRPFDAILLDAPCSASGIVRRHPDVRWLRRPQDLVALAQTQSALLEALWPLLRPGGRLLYATCSVFRDEGDRQIDAFLQRVGPSQARLDPLSPGHLLPLGEIPIDNQPHSAAVAAPLSADGFYYALIHKA
jgi:16S rRNA (cytosine967-C5)-methyltransferase